MSHPEDARLEIELQLLNAMYPGQTHYSPKSREFKFSDDSHAALLLRLPDTYPEAASPDIVSATDAAKNDLRAHTKRAVKELGLAPGEEALDAVIATFLHVLASTTSPSPPDRDTGPTPGTDDRLNTSKTVIIWLHHLLNTNKRKLALSPPPSTPLVSGLTKPGYPGVLVYSGPASAVIEHVNTLKAQNWQAFQVRYEEQELWHFAHGTGVKEVESMSEVVKGVEREAATGKGHKEEFLKAVGIK
ncbi:hypothetical protein BDW02DRAFT_504455 [Decorospora gaudefroyi]|uniref:RWD domain-containing protein n=1 Tax=Decorospora gaudefroyi TaxID=184978 RepID=A0A6A5KAI2_9PLEO|nr:hypothetical protein BDW02DRAFT_504455 [Decorospora gaudefroyi]